MWWKVPPEIFVDGEISVSFEIDALDYVVILDNAFYSAPEIKNFILVLLTKF